MLISGQAHERTVNGLLRVTGIVMLVLAASAAAVPPETGNARAQSGTGLHVVLTAQNLTMTWTQTQLLTATVTLNGTPLVGATVRFSSSDRARFEPGEGRTDHDGNITTEYNDRYGYRSVDTVTAAVEYGSAEARATLNITLESPPPTVLLGDDPRDPPAILTVWACSGAGAGILVIMLAAVVRHERRWERGGG